MAVRYDSKRYSCSQAAYDVLEGMKKGTKILSFEEAREKILDSNVVDRFFKDETEAMVFIADNLKEAVKTMNDYGMYRRYSARLDPLKDPVSFADAMIERKALEVRRGGHGVKPGQDVLVCHLLDDGRTFEEVVEGVSGRMKYDMAFGGSFEALTLDSMSYGMDAAHTSEQEAAFFLMRNTEHYLEEYDFELSDRSSFLSDAVGWEARIIGEKAVEGILAELEQAGVDVRDDSAVSEFYDWYRPSLDEEIETADRIKDSGSPACEECREDLADAVEH